MTKSLKFHNMINRIKLNLQNPRKRKEILVPCRIDLNGMTNMNHPSFFQLLLKSKFIQDKNQMAKVLLMISPWGYQDQGKVIWLNLKIWLRSIVLIKERGLSFKKARKVPLVLLKFMRMEMKFRPLLSVILIQLNLSGKSHNPCLWVV